MVKQHRLETEKVLRFIEERIGHHAFACKRLARQMGFRKGQTVRWPVEQLLDDGKLIIVTRGCATYYRLTWGNNHGQAEVLHGIQP